MKIIYDDLLEFTEARLRCETTRESEKCEFCPFCDRCDSLNDENIHTMCCEILSMKDHPTEKGGAE